ncbi:LemA family protein [Pseudomarimonas salicorniae]|uniref:LemA family protein n=1 Tax=Pseudomarimonas salicorniae TaxID=2933270 RepID=A0ABT0GDR0_9GAMM|nr:LemA family protein [Lysobacter sp. CAU 1642]MCK7592155.1 LemA family protein [Lysobacter sp. CAU 1642]
MTGLIIIVVLLVGIGLWLVGLYNGLIRARNGFRNAYAQIDVQLHRRHDLIPNLVETAKAYLSHEKDTLEAVIRARNAAMQASDAAKGHAGEAQAMQQLAGAENALTQTLGKLFALSEAYPDLKANTTMMQLNEELTSTENKVAFARQAYNDQVMTYNNRRETFPANLFAGGFGFPMAAPLEIAIADAHKREAPRVSFG